MNSRSVYRKEPVRTPGPTVRHSKPFFRRADWIAFWTVTLLSFALYFHTLAPTVTLEDSGEMAVASDYLGVPHPPGYPIWTLVTWFFQWIFHWVRFYGQPDSNLGLIWKSFLDLFTPGSTGHPNPAWSVGLASAVFGALACGLLSMLLCRSGRDMLVKVRRKSDSFPDRIRSGFCWAASVSAGLILACSPVLWSQSVIVEVYSLNAFFQMLMVLLLYRWVRRPWESRTLYATAFVFGLGLTNHQTLAFMAPSLVVAILLTDLRLFRDFAITGAALLGIVAVNVWASKNEAPDLLWSRGPEFPAFWVATGLAVAIPLLAMAVLPKGRVVGATILLIELGLAFYLFMPFASEQNPPMNWGYPRTWTGFLHALTRGQYDTVSPGSIFSPRFVTQLGLYLRDLRGQFSMPIVLIGFLPFCSWRLTWKNRSYSAFWTALIVGFAAVPLIILEGPLQAKGMEQMAFVARKGYVVLSGLVVLAGGVGALAMGLRSLDRIFRKLRGSDKDPWIWILMGLLFAGIFLALLYSGIMVMRAGFQHPGWGSSLLGVVAVAGPVCAAVLLWKLAVRSDALTLELPSRTWRWTILLMVAFVSVSFGFLAVANNDLDIQTQRIIRVQLIQSHAVFVFWLGYGILLTLTHQQSLLRPSKPDLAGITAVALALPGVLLWQNAYAEEKLRILGGAEQNGHTFGWMFGYWSMRGVNGIREELSPEEWAEYPTPDYPPEMEPNAIFFGGTDPGRFVPTYMIYSARVREDIFLITQNALADATYMSVMRDLYGDQIWIPSARDNNLAFEIFLQDVRAGRAPAGADILEQDGRVSVQGVQGVMQINGILTRMIFDRNQFRHPFYVEESYVIPWMYPYLEPHGLILKLNREPVDFTPVIVARDMAFWEWLVNRLLRNPRFIRDVNARKTFSKLRSAMGGVYGFRNLHVESETAFRQAISLYPLSPEAHSRLVEVLLKQHKFEEAFQWTSNLLRQDPLNERARHMLQGVSDLRLADRRRLEIEALFPRTEIDARLLLELAMLYRQLQMWGGFEHVANLLLSTPGLDSRIYVDLAQISLDLRRWDFVEAALRRALENPDATAALWSDLALIYLTQQKMPEMWAALDQGLARHGPDLRRLLISDARFQDLRSHPEFLRRVSPAALPGQPGIPERLRRLLR